MNVGKTQKRLRQAAGADVRLDAPFHRGREERAGQGAARQGANNAFFEPIYTKNNRFTKTGSGQT
jgi:hypothetical protein